MEFNRLFVAKQVIVMKPFCASYDFDGGDFEKFMNGDEVRKSFRSCLDVCL